MERSGGEYFNDSSEAFASSFSEGALLDASQHPFFGKYIVDELELEGFEDEVERVPEIGGAFGGEEELHEYHLFDKDEVKVSRFGSLSDVDDLTTTFSKVGWFVDPEILTSISIYDAGYDYFFKPVVPFSDQL